MAIPFNISERPEVTFSIENVKAGLGGGGSGNVSSAQINTIVVLDRAEYDSLAVKDAKTLYLIRG